MPGKEVPGLFRRSGKFINYIQVIWCNGLEFKDKMDLTIRMRMFIKVKVT